MSDELPQPGQSTFALFAQTAEAVGSTTKRLEKVAILGGYLASLSDEDLAVACKLLSGSPFPLSDSRTLNVGFSAASGVLVDLSGVTANAYHKLVVSMGDMGDVAARIMPASPHEAGEPLL